MTTVSKAVRAWVADAEALATPGFDLWFPDAFDWRAFCADVPRMVERLGARFTGPAAAAGRARLEDLAGSAFRGAYLATLAILSGYDRAADPEDAFERLTSPLPAAEAEAFETSVEEDLDRAEAAMASQGEEARGAGEGGAGNGAVPSPGAGRAAGKDPVDEVARIASLVGPTVRALLSEGLEGAARSLASLGVAMDAAAKVLAGVVNVGIAVAALRYAAAADADREEGKEPLAYDAVSMRAALGA